MPIPIPPNIIHLLLFMSSIFSTMGTTAEFSEVPPAWVHPSHATACGVYFEGNNKMWVNTLKTENNGCFSHYNQQPVEQYQVGVHEFGHAVDARCMSDADRDYVTAAMGLAGIPWDAPGIFSPQEQFADAVGQALSGMANFHSGPANFRIQNSALSYLARCSYKYEFYSVHYSYQVFNEVYAPQITKETWVARIARGYYTPVQFTENHVWKTQRVRKMSAEVFADHLFNEVLNRNTTYGAERNAWYNYSRSHTKEQTFDLLMRVLYP